MSEPIDAALLKTGQQQFMVCGACHGQAGEGTAAAPPLAGSEWVTGPVENLIRIQFRGLQGPIKVKGQEYNFPAGMMPMAYQTDDQIAAVLTYVRNSFGNTASAVTTEEVAALRGEVGQPQLKASELIQPPVAEKAATGTTEAAPVSTKYDNLKTDLGLPGWVVVVVLLFIGTSVIAAFRK